MTIKRTFLTWRQPCLPQACDWILQQASSDPAASGHPVAAELDLSSWTFVLPTARAGRRLLELLVAATAGRAMTPPRIITARKLPELLAPCAQPEPGELQNWLLRAQAISDTPVSDLKILLPHPPGKDDAIGLLLLARDIQALDDELTLSALCFEDVVRHTQSADSYDDHLRWQVLADMQQVYHQHLAARGLADSNATRIAHIKNNLPSNESRPFPLLPALAGRLVIIACTDLPRLTTSLLTAHTSQVDVLIHAPNDEADHFDALGNLHDAHWRKREIPLDASRIHVVNQPVEQAREVARIVASLDPLPEAQQVAIGLGDETEAPLLGQTLTRCGMPTRHVAGKLLSQSPPAVILQHVASLLGTCSLRELATLMRCPAADQWLRARLAVKLGASSHADQFPLLEFMDRYIQERLPHDLPISTDTTYHHTRTLTPESLMKMAWDELQALLPENWQKPAPLQTWQSSIATLLQAFFGQRELHRYDIDDALLIRAIQMIADALKAQASLSGDLPLADHFTLQKTIELLLIQLAGQLIPPEAGEPAAELLGWRELMLDDAPHAVVTGFNEGRIPRHQNHDWLLPDTLRQQLGLADNQHRHCQDAYALTSVLHSKRTLDLLACRNDAQGDPQLPSRLLFATDVQTACNWINHFFKSEKDQSGLSSLLLTPAPDRSKSAFTVPRPQPLLAPIQKLRVTAFRDYLNCPYRFYLKHVLKLAALDDRANEMDAMSFGTLAHDILNAFGRCEHADSDDPALIEQYLTEELHRRIVDFHDHHPPAVVILQQEILRQRLAAFAIAQAKLNAQGWRIVSEFQEKEIEVARIVDDQPFTIHGKIDRIDHHPVHGYRLLDYKTSEAGDGPDNTHYEKDQWIDLQLPLYHLLASQGLKLQGNISLGYILLPNDLKKVDIKLATWDQQQLQGAFEAADDVIRAIRNEQFTLKDKPLYPDEFSDLCMENVLDATAIDDTPSSASTQSAGGSHD